MKSFVSAFVGVFGGTPESNCPPKFAAVTHVQMSKIEATAESKRHHLGIGVTMSVAQACTSHGPLKNVWRYCLPEGQ